MTEKNNNNETGKRDQKQDCDLEKIRDDRRKTVRNILSGAGVVAIGGSTDSWIAPSVKAVILPSHAATSSSGSQAGASLVGSIGGEDLGSVLDYFIQSGYADTGLLNKGCLSLSIVNNLIFGEITYTNSETDTGQGELGKDVIADESCEVYQFAFSIGGVTVRGEVNDAQNPTQATGTVDGISFSANFGATCQVTAPTTTTCVPNGTSCPA